MNPDAILTIGKNATCDLQLDHPSVSGLHAQARLDPGLFMWVRDENSAGGMHLYRNENWVQARLVSLCVGDRLRFGDVEIKIEQLTSLFGPEVDVRLAPAPEPSFFDSRLGRYTLRDMDQKPTLLNPRRNTETGEMEEAATESDDRSTETPTDRPTEGSPFDDDGPVGR